MTTQRELQKPPACHGKDACYSTMPNCKADAPTLSDVVGSELDCELFWGRFEIFLAFIVGGGKASVNRECTAISISLSV